MIHPSALHQNFSFPFRNTMRILEVCQGLYDPCCLVGDHNAWVNEEIEADISMRSQERKASTALVDDSIDISHKPINSTEKSTALVQTDFLFDVPKKCCPVINRNQFESALISTLQSNATKKAMLTDNSKSVGRRRSRADSVRSVFTNFTQLRACNNMHIECVGRVSPSIPCRFA
jgi:hypothetical protein